MDNPINFNVFKWTDEAAPGISYIGSIGTSSGLGLISVLDACLVGTSGVAYGSKASLGWTKPYQSGDYHVYRMGANSSGRYLQVYAANATQYQDYSVLYLNVYDSMTSATEGVNPITRQTSPASKFIRGAAWSHGGTGISYGNTDHNVPWILVGNSAGFYLWKTPYAPTSPYWGIGGIASYANRYLAMTGCLDILSYSIEDRRTILLADGINSSCSMHVYRGYPPQTIGSKYWNSEYASFISNSNAFNGMPMTSSNVIGLLKVPRALLNSDEIFTCSDGKIFAGSPQNTTKYMSKIFVVTAPTDGSNSAEIVGELPGIYRFTADFGLDSFQETDDHLVFSSININAAYHGSYAVAIKKNGDWYGNPHFL